MDRQTKERTKLTATLLNGLALAVLVATIITPAVQWLGSAGVFATSVLGGLVAVALHIFARRLLAWRSGRPKTRAAPHSSAEHHPRPFRR